MEIIEKAGFCVAGVQVRGFRKELLLKMPLVWKHFLSEFGSGEGLNGRNYVNVSLEAHGDYDLQMVGMVVAKHERISGSLKCVEIPAQRYVYFQHKGQVNSIGDSFKRMYHWAAKQGLDAGDFKMDFGYTASGEEAVHHLHIGLLPVKWRYIQN